MNLPDPQIDARILDIHGADDLSRAGAHAKLHHVYRYWRSLHRDGRIPGRAQIDPAAIPDLLSGLWLLDVQREPFRLRYRLVGTRVVRAIGREVTGQWLDEAHPGIGRDPAYQARSRKVVQTAIPSWRHGRPNLWRHELFGKIENLILPLAADGARVEMLMIMTVFYGQDGIAW